MFLETVALQAAYDAQMAGHQAGLQPAQPQESRSRREMRASNEYARAFAYAMKNGINRRNGRGNEKVSVLFDALTEGGGDPAGEDGGFLVPVDIDNQIKELKRALNPLSDLFNVETVSAPTGWRVMDTAPTTGMSSVNEM
ncbi:MAG: phage major capsid protein, partial [Thermoguttaceae bacterium]|nr:phage major capsid protein [Thermoguttaceae bacterium]